MDEGWVLCQALRTNQLEKKSGPNSRKVKRNVQEDERKESWAKNCWFGQGSVAKNGEGTFLLSKEGSCFHQKCGIAGVSLGNLERGRAQSIAYL